VDDLSHIDNVGVLNCDICCKGFHSFYDCVLTPYEINILDVVDVQVFSYLTQLEVS